MQPHPPTSPPPEEAPKPLPPWMALGPLERVSNAVHHFIRSGTLLMFMSAFVFGVALFMIWRQLSTHSWSAVLDAFGRIPSEGFFFASILVIASYTLITFNDRLALKIIGRQLKRRQHMAASVAGYAIARSLGYAFLTAATARMRLYAAAGLTAAETGRLSLYTGLTAQAGAATACALGLLIGVNQLMHRAQIPRSISVGLALALLIIVFVWVKNNARGGPNARENSPSAWMLVKHIMAAALAWICAAGVLYQLMDVRGLAFPAFVAGFVLATVAGALSGVPGGLGVFEATMLAFMPRAQGLPSTAAALIVYRLMYNAAPLAFAAAVLAWDQWGAAHRAASRRAARKAKAQCPDKPDTGD